MCVCVCVYPLNLDPSLQDLQDSPLVEETLVDPQDLTGRMLEHTAAPHLPFPDQYPRRLDLDDTFEAVPTEGKGLFSLII